MKMKAKMQPREVVSLGWVLLVTFLLGLPIVFLTYGEHEDMKEILLFLYMFLEFLPMVLYLLAILLPSLSPHLLLPWVIINVILLLISSILALSLSMAEPTLPMVLLALAISLLLIFPILFAIIMYLPIIVYIKKLVPNYKRKIKRSSVYRKVTGTKTAEEIEEEIKVRRKEQVKNVVITDTDFAQFIYVNRAAQKWKTKLKKKPKKEEPEEELKDILEEGNITVNQSYEMDVLEMRARALQEASNGSATWPEPLNGNVTRIEDENEPLITNGVQTKVNLNGKFVTDV